MRPFNTDAPEVSIGRVLISETNESGEAKHVLKGTWVDAAGEWLGAVELGIIVFCKT